MKRILLFISLLLVLMLCSCEKEKELTPAEAVVKQISDISAAETANAVAVDDAVYSYAKLSEEEKEAVSNYSDLLKAKEKLTVATHTDGVRIPRNKLLIGTYCLSADCRTDENIKAIADCGIDFVASAPYDADTLALFEKYNIGAYISYLPGWWGGDGENAGMLDAAAQIAQIEEKAKAFVDYPAIWTMDVGDEPNAKDFPAFGEVIKKTDALFKNQTAYLNLYPNYANEAQLGTVSYQKHIDSYVKNIDTDYICYDHYMYGINDKGRLAFDNLRIVANAYRDNDRDFWIVLQVNSNNPDVWISEYQLRYQAYTALAFGVKSINWACWSAGWWNNQVFENGQPTQQYEKLKAVNTDLHALSDVYMRYTNKDAFFIGDKSREFLELFMSNDDNICDTGLFQYIDTSRDDSSVLVGYFEQNNGDGKAIMLVNASECSDGEALEEEVYFSIEEKEGKTPVVYTYTKGEMTELIPDGGIYTVKLLGADGVFVTADYR